MLTHAAAPVPFGDTTAPSWVLMGKNDSYNYTLVKVKSPLKSVDNEGSYLGSLLE